MDIEMLQSVRQIVTIFLIPLFLGTIVYALKIVSDYVNYKIKDKRILNILTYSEKIISDSIVAILNDYKEKISDGVLSKEDEEQVIEKAKQMSLNMMNGSLEAGIKEFVPNSDVWIADKVKCALVSSLTKKS